MPPSCMQGLLWRFLRKVALHPPPEPLLECLRLLVTEPLSDFLPGVTLAQHLEDLPDLLAMILIDATFDQIK